MTYTLKRDYIPLTRITYQAFGFDKNKTVRRLSYFWRRCGDLNPSAGRTDLPDFESGPFNHLGTSPNRMYYTINAKRFGIIVHHFRLPAVQAKKSDIL